MSNQTATTILQQEEMLHICADRGRDAIVTVIAPYLIERQAIARKLLEYHGEHRQVFIDMINHYNKEIAKLMGLMPHDTLIP